MSVLGFVKDILLGPVTEIADEFIHSGEEKAAAKQKGLDAIIGAVEQIEDAIKAETDAKKEIMVAELNQGDKFTKRARPSIIYGGLIIAFLETAFRAVIVWRTMSGVAIEEIGNVVAQAAAIPSIAPEQFWWAWTGVASSWVIGRSAERRGIQNKFVQLATGNKPK